MGILQAAKAVLLGGHGSGAWMLAGVTLALLLVAARRRRRAKTLDGVIVNQPGQHTVRFGSVGGAATAKAALLRLGTPLRIDPSAREQQQRSRRQAAPIARGAFLHGPSGCGKTLLAQALAGELNLPLYTISAVTLSALRGGAGAAQLHKLLATAVRSAPCILFIDDLDALSPPPAAPPELADEARAQLVQKLTSGLEGLARRAARVVVLTATRRADLIDEALLRPGRLGRPIAVTLPDERERADIIALLACAHPVLASLDARALAARTANASGADLGALLARLAHKVAARLHSAPASPPEVTADDLEQALSGDSPPREPG